MDRPSTVPASPSPSPRLLAKLDRLFQEKRLICAACNHAFWTVDEANTATALCLLAYLPMWPPQDGQGHVTDCIKFEPRPAPQAPSSPPQAVPRA